MSLVLIGIIVVVALVLAIAMLGMSEKFRCLELNLRVAECRLDRQQDSIEDLNRCCTELCNVVNGDNEGGRCMGKKPIRAPGA